MPPLFAVACKDEEDEDASAGASLNRWCGVKNWIDDSRQHADGWILLSLLAQMFTHNEKRVCLMLRC